MSFLSTKCVHCSTEKIKLNVQSFYIANNRHYFLLSCEGCDKPTTIQAEIIQVYIDASRRRTRNIDFHIDEEIDLSKKFKNLKLVILEQNKKLIQCPPYVPTDIEACFNEASICLQAECYIACSSMLRLCLDLTTKKLLDEAEGKKIDKLYERINYLIEKQIIPSDLKDFSHNIRLDGNDAAHDGTTSIGEANDLIDFTILLLERVYTNKEKLRLAEIRRKERRSTT